MLSSIIALAPVLAQAKPSQAPTNLNPPTAYVDRLIDPTKAEDAPPAAANPPPNRPVPEGLRSVSVTWETLHNRPQGQPGTTAHHFNLDAYRQTRNYGDWTMDARLRQTPRINYAHAHKETAEITLQQHNMLLDEKWSMENTLGTVRSHQNALFGQAHQASLPSLGYTGVASRASDGKTELRLMAGRKDKQRAENSNTPHGQVLGASAVHQWDATWTIGAQGWHAEHSDGRQRQELALIAQHQDPAGIWESQAQVLQNNHATGIWLGTTHKGQRTQHRAGLYHLGSGLTWMGEDVADDQSGLHWDMSHSQPRYSSYSSAHLQQRRHGQDKRATNELRLTQTLSHQYNRQTRIGGRIGHNRSSGGRANEQYHASVYIDRHWRNGQYSRLQLAANQDHLPTAHANQTATTTRSAELDYTHAWQLNANDDLTWQINVRRENNNGEHRTIQQTGFNWQHQLDADNNLGLDFSVNRSNGISGTITQRNARLFSQHHLNRHWTLQASLQQSHDDAGKRDRNATLALSYQDHWGKALGKGDIRSGTIRGVVFFDENSDGRQQPLEKRAVNIEVLLDGRTAVRTDQNGEFEFRPVGVGSHRLSVGLGSIPLPWEVAQSFNPEVQVSLRATAHVAIPLATIQEQTLNQ